MKNHIHICFAAVIVCFMQAIALGQFYQPDRKEYQTPARYGLKYESLTFESRDKTKLHAWFVPATGKAIGTVIHFHGNAQNLSAHFSFTKWLPQKGFNLFIFDYRGYGKSEGSPSRNGIQEDGIAALHYIKSRTEIEQDKLFILGQSLGGAICISALAEAKIEGICGIVVESTFDSYQKIAKEKAPAILAELFVSDAHSPERVIADLAPTPIVVIHGTADRVVPYARGKSLFDQASQPKGLWTVKGGGHTPAFTTHGTTYQPKLISFFTKCIEHSKAKQQ
jgi:hypothetical protein